MLGGATDNPLIARRRVRPPSARTGPPWRGDDADRGRRAPPDDPRVLGTVAAVEEDLLRDRFVLRYRTETGVDELPGDENAFLACTGWLARTYALSGRLDEAEEVLDRLAAVSNDVGLLSEEYDPRTGKLLGNFPEAFSHLALIQAALAVRDARDATGTDGRR